MRVFAKFAPLVVVGAVGFLAGNATAADPMLAAASDSIHKAIYQVQGAADEGDVRRFERKRARALKKLCKADYVVIKMTGEEYSQPSGSPCWDILGIEPAE